MNGGILFWVCFTLVGAHPVPRENHDRRILVRTTPDRIEVLYRLEVDESRAVLDLVEHDRDLSSVKTKEDIHRLYLDWARDTIPRGLILKVPTGEKTWTARLGETQLTDHLRIDLFLVCSRDELAEGITLRLEEANFADDDKSLLVWGGWPGLEGGPVAGSARAFHFRPDAMAKTSIATASQQGTKPPVIPKTITPQVLVPVGGGP